MRARIHLVSRQSTASCITAIILGGLAGSLPATSAWAQSGEIKTDPQTGMAYREVNRTVTRPVETSRTVTRNETVYKPRTVTETRATPRTVWRGVVEGQWEPYVANRWNPFSRPSIAYRYVTKPRWEARTEVVNTLNTRTEYVAETRPVLRTETTRQMVQQRVTELEPVGTVQPVDDPASELALRQRLRPIGSNERIVPFGTGQGVATRAQSAAPRIASSTVGGVGRMRSDPPRRGLGHAGQPATDLTRQSGYGQALGQPVAPLGIATGPLPIMR